jgi:dTDP-4-amino-4,6-dideoxygalactose transaminase
MLPDHHAAHFRVQFATTTDTAMSSIPINDLKPAAILIRDELVNAIRDVVESHWFLEGPQASAFESEFAAYVGCKYAVAVGNGTDALELALRAVGVTERDEVISVANAGGYTTTACMAIGATPFYADVDPDSLLLDVERLSECVNDRTRAIVVTHLYGRMVNVARVRELVGPRIPIIEDCAQAHGATLNGARAGASGDLSTFSFYPTKNLGAIGDAGMVLAHASTLHDRLRQLKQYGWSSRYNVAISHGRNSRMDEVQAAVLRVKLPHLDRWNTERRDIAAIYDEVLHSGAFRCFRGNHLGNVHHLYVARHPNREAVRARLQELGVSTAVHYPTLDCDQPGLAGIPMKSADLRCSRDATREILTLPCYPGLSPQAVEQVVCALRELARR